MSSNGNISFENNELLYLKVVFNQISDILAHNLDQHCTYYFYYIVLYILWKIELAVRKVKHLCLNIFFAYKIKYMCMWNEIF